MSQRFFDDEPTDWKSLELKVNQAFLEMGYRSSIGRKITSIRGDVFVDVYATKDSSPIPTIVCCECKYWVRSVPRSVVHAFRTVCGDIGAHFGLIISKKGFQSGSDISRTSTNIHLMNFEEFQEIFFSEWKSGISMLFAKMRDQILPIIRASSRMERYGTDIIGSIDIDMIDILMKYGIFFGSSEGFSSFFLFAGDFPTEIRDPRGDPREASRVIVKSHRQYIDIAKEAVAQCMERFNLPEIYFTRNGDSITPVDDTELMERMRKYGVPILS